MVGDRTGFDRDTIGTDNVTLTLAQKQAAKGMWEALPGYPAVGTHFPVILHYGVSRRGLDLLRTRNGEKFFFDKFHSLLYR